MPSTLINYDDGVLRARIGRWEQVQPELRTRVRRLAIEVQTAVKTDKLTGQVLHVRTGTLRRSINQHVDETGNSIIATVGTNVVYARPHEYGFSGPVNVRSYTRRSTAQMAVPARKRDSRSEGVITVRSFVRMMNLPERSFLRSTLREWGPRIVEDIRSVAKNL